MTVYLDFEKDLAEIQSKIADLESLPDSSSSKNIKNEIEKLSIKPDKELNHGEIELKVNGITIRKTII